MKSIITLTAALFFTTFAMAQQEKVETITVPVQLEITIKKEVKADQGTEVARLYMFKNSRVKKEVNFQIKRTELKIA